MTITFKKEDLNDINALTTLSNEVSSANKGFLSVVGFKPRGGCGEVQNTLYCKGTNYQNTISKSLTALEIIEGDNDFEISVKRGVWKDEDGNISPTSRKSKVFSKFETVRESYKRGDEPLETALEAIRKSLTNPYVPHKTDYKKVGDSVYIDDEGHVYVRDLIVIKKNVVVAGDYPNKASSAKVAIENEIKKEMPIGKYRQFRFDGDYDCIRVGGRELVQI